MSTFVYHLEDTGEVNPRKGCPKNIFLQLFVIHSDFVHNMYKMKILGAKIIEFIVGQKTHVEFSKKRSNCSKKSEEIFNGKLLEKRKEKFFLRTSDEL